MQIRPAVEAAAISAPYQAPLIAVSGERMNPVVGRFPGASSMHLLCPHCHNTIELVQFTANEDTRISGNSPYSPGWAPPPVPPDGKWVVQATFSEPGTYVLQCLAHDGALSTSQSVTFTVAR